MNRDERIRKILKSLTDFFVFFLLVAFVITCCMTLFITVMSNTLGIELNGENLNVAAKLTMGNVVFLSLLLCVFDTVRRKLTVDRPVKRITDAAEKIMQGDFSVRIERNKEMNHAGRFGEIAECMNKMAEELSGTETLRTDFIANVSHELKTPLAAMQNYGTLLQSTELSEKQRLEYGKAITEQTRRLSKLVMNILKLNKLENQQIYPNVENYYLSEQLCECMLEFESVWEEKNIEIDTDIEEDIQIEADKELLSLVWNNLLSNALKFTEENGKVSLSLRKDEKYAYVEVKDTGCGMSAETGKNIFKKFYQGDTSHATKGNGLGLALVKRVIDICGGEISVSSQLGEGSTFTVKLRRRVNG